MTTNMSEVAASPEVLPRRTEAIALLALAVAAAALGVSITHPGPAPSSSPDGAKPAVVIDWYAASWQQALELPPAALVKHFAAG